MKLKILPNFTLILTTNMYRQSLQHTSKKTKRLAQWSQKVMLNIKTAAKQVWLYFIRRTTRPGYAGTATNLQIVLNTKKNPYMYFDQATKKILAKFPTQKIPD